MLYGAVEWANVETVWDLDMYETTKDLTCWASFRVPWVQNRSWNSARVGSALGCQAMRCKLQINTTASRSFPSQIRWCVMKENDLFSKPHQLQKYLNHQGIVQSGQDGIVSRFWIAFISFVSTWWASLHIIWFLVGKAGHWQYPGDEVAMRWVDIVLALSAVYVSMLGCVWRAPLSSSVSGQTLS